MEKMVCLQGESSPRRQRPGAKPLTEQRAEPSCFPLNPGPGSEARSRATTNL